MGCSSYETSRNFSGNDLSAETGNSLADNRSSDRSKYEGILREEDPVFSACQRGNRPVKLIQLNLREFGILEWLIIVYKWYL